MQLEVSNSFVEINTVFQYDKGHLGNVASLFFLQKVYINLMTTTIFKRNTLIYFFSAPLLVLRILWAPLAKESFIRNNIETEIDDISENSPGVTDAAAVVE